MFCYFSYQQLMEKGQSFSFIIFDMMCTLQLHKLITVELCFSDLSIVNTFCASKVNKAENFLYNNTMVSVAFLQLEA